MIKNLLLSLIFLTFLPFSLPAGTVPCSGAPSGSCTAPVPETTLEKVRKAFVEASIVSYAPDEAVTRRFIEYSDHGRANDVLLLQLYMAVHLPDDEVQSLLDSFDWEEGCWKDIDYTAQDRGRWPATLHLTRMYALAKLYRYPGQHWEGSEKLRTLLHSGMAWWFRNMPVCPNWWHNDIGVPKKMTAVLLMLRDELSEQEMAGGLKVLERSRFGMTGQNKVWLAGNNLMKGLLTDDAALVQKAKGQIAEEIYITSSEGIQDDWSFHQHGPQIQFGNYGLAYADGVSFWIRVLDGTEYAFSPEQVDIVAGLLKNGICRCVFKGVMDPSFCGRQNFIDAGTGKAFALSVAAQNMAAASEGDPEFFRKVALENLQPEKYRNSITGPVYYRRSDCGIYRRPDWYASIRMHSDRTIGFEFTNRENTLANFSADGALILMQDGHEFENIFACWDWRKVPGVTAYDDGKQIKCDDSVAGKRNWSSHVGGAVSGDVMAATMELQRDGLHAFKSTFFFEDCVVNLGSGITVSRDDFRSVTTAVDQVHLAGKITSGKNWVHHNGRGYVSLDGASLMVSDTLQKGKWDDIDPAFKDKWDETRVFKCWFDHPLGTLRDGNRGTYAYALVPCSTARQTAAFASRYKKGRAPVEVLRNDALCQAVRHGDVLCAVFHTPGSYSLGDKVFDISVPSVIISGASGSQAVTELPETMEHLSARVFERAWHQLSLLDRNLGAAAETLSRDSGRDTLLFPRTLDKDGNLVTSNIRWWCSGFYPGSLWYVYDYTGDPAVKALAEKYTSALEPLKFRKDDHDIGFQIMCSFGNEYAATGDPHCREVIDTAAASLCTRFNPAAGCTRSWNFGKWKFPVIIDNIMNMELLLKAYTFSGNELYRQVAVSHALTTMKNHFRPDHSCWHLVDYDPLTGEVLGKQTVQGFSDSSAWSRGQAWALYGYTMMYRYTQDRRFLDHAVAVADYLLARLPEDGIPYWDYDSDEIPDDFRDASAAAVMASGLTELSSYVRGEKSFLYLSTAEKMLRTLASDSYLASEGDLRGFLLKHSVGNKPGDSEVDVPLTYADYYFLEALLRYLGISRMPR